MTTTLLDRVPLDEISTRARDIRPGRTLLTVIGGVIFGAFWLAAKAWMVAWRALTWCWAAGSLGWEAAHGPSRGQQIATLTAQVEHLLAENGRLGGSG